MIWGNAQGAKGPWYRQFSNKMEGRGEMTKAPVSLQDLRKRIYIKAKAEKSHRFWGLFVHICKLETLRAAHQMAKENDGAPGIDGVTFEAIEVTGIEAFLLQIQNDLISGAYRPLRNRKVEIPKDNGQVRVLGIPTIRDRVVQGAVKLILEPIFEADFQQGSYGYRPKRTAHEAVDKVAEAVVYHKTRVIDLDLRAYFDNVRHDILLKKIAGRIEDGQVMRLLKQLLKARGKRGLSQGGVLSPLMANLYLNDVDKMLEKAKQVTQRGRLTALEYCRWADDLVILVDEYPRWDWLWKLVQERLHEELAKLDIEINLEKTRMVDLRRNEGFSFLGFDFRRVKTLRKQMGVRITPKTKARTALFRKLKEIFRCHKSRPLEEVIARINPILRGWVNYFRVGHSSNCFNCVKRSVEKKVRRHLNRARLWDGFGWKRWSSSWLYKDLGLFNDYQVKYCPSKSLPVHCVT